MLPEEIAEILIKYQNEVVEEISSINLALGKISHEINSISSVLMDKLSVCTKNTNIINEDIEDELLKTSQKLRKYALSIKTINLLCEQDECIGKGTESQLDLYDLIVLSNTLKCSYGEHQTVDIIAQIPVINSNGDLELFSVQASFCNQCKRYTILKDDFKRINGNIMCKVIDETLLSERDSDDEIDIEQRKSVLYTYGYNVKAKTNLSSIQRHIILASVIEARILNRRQIADHLTILIERGSKIPRWKDATNKWKEDKYYVQEYKTENLPKVIFDRIILRHKRYPQLSTDVDKII